MKKHRKRSSNTRYLLKAHRYIGLSSFIILLWLAVSGLLLNHTEELQLDNQFTQNSFLLDLYNIPTPILSKGNLINKHWIFSLDNKLYWQENILNDALDAKLIGSLLKNETLFIALENKVLFFTPKGDFIDELTFEGKITKIGVINKENIAINSSQEGCFYLDHMLTYFTKCNVNSTPNWVKLYEIPQSYTSQFIRDYQGAKISLERVFLDLHSGRIFGKSGVYFMDIMALLIIVLGVSGIFIWSARKIKQYQRKYKNSR